MTAAYNPFRLTLKSRWLASTIERLLGLDTLANCYDQRPHPQAERPADNVDEFLDQTLNTLGASIELGNPDALDNIPKEGPVIFIANHPFGGLEGVAMTQHLRKVRPDLKVLTNELLAKIPEFGDTFIGVDVLSKNAAAKNGRGMREIIKHLKNNGAILIYPAGMVSAINLQTGRIEDRQWNNIIGKLIKQFDATCVPFYVHGRNSRLFYLAGLIHPRLRTILLPRELGNKDGRTFSLTIGSPITNKDLKALNGDPDAVTAYLRIATDLLSKHRETDEYTASSHPPLAAPERSEQEQTQLQTDLAGMQEYKLLESRGFEVYCTPYQQLGSFVQEIAVARERTFRAAGEGTGKPFDSDHFDPHYMHLFVWDTKNSAIVGGYRIGKVDQILENQGIDGLYSRSLYEFDEQYIRRFGQSLEMGRSFVTQEYQRHPRALDLLWQGIGNWVALNPEYHTLFGCVSISREHSLRARAFLKESLMQSFRAEQEFLTDVRPVAPLKVRDKVWSKEVLKSLSDLTLINKLLGQCDPGKSVPILLRQYIALNGRFINFTVNRSFNDSLDGLIIVDLRKTPPKYLQRYLGKSGSENFLNHWSVDRASA